MLILQLSLSLSVVLLFCGDRSPFPLSPAVAHCRGAQECAACADRAADAVEQAMIVCCPLSPYRPTLLSRSGGRGARERDHVTRFFTLAHSSGGRRARAPLFIHSRPATRRDQRRDRTHLTVFGAAGQLPWIISRSNAILHVGALQRCSASVSDALFGDHLRNRTLVISTLTSSATLYVSSLRVKEFVV